MNRMTLRLMHENCIKSMYPGSILNRAVVGEEYRVWEVPQTTILYTYDWLGNFVGTRRESHVLFVFLGARGSIIVAWNVTPNGLPDDIIENHKIITEIELSTRQKYFNINS